MWKLTAKEVAAMYDANTMRILFRFSQIPITVYTSEWKSWIDLPAYIKSQILLRGK